MVQEEDVSSSMRKNGNLTYGKQMIIVNIGILYVTLCSVNIFWSVIPTKLKVQGFSSHHFGYFISLYSLIVISVMTASTYFIKNLSSLGGYKRLLQVSILFVLMTVLSFGVLEFVKINSIYGQVYVISQILQGITTAIIAYAMMVSIGKKLFPENMDQFIGYIMSITGFGIILGKYIGDALNTDEDDKKVICALGGMFLFIAIFEVYVFREQDLHSIKSDIVEKEKQEMEVDYSSSRESNETVVSEFELIQYPRVLFSGISTFLAFLSTTCSIPIIVGHLLRMGAGYNIVALLCAV